VSQFETGPPPPGLPPLRRSIPYEPGQLPIAKALNCSKMQKTTAMRTDRACASDRQYKTNGFHIPKNPWELLNRVAFERARTKGGRASESALLAELVEKHQKQLERELTASR
jgi:hypothetical protein